MKYLVPALVDLWRNAEGAHRLAPVRTVFAWRASHRLLLSGRRCSPSPGLDMAAWDALGEGGRRAALRSAGRLRRPGARVQQQRIVAARNQMRWQRRRSSYAKKEDSPASNFGLDATASRDDLATIEAVRNARWRRHAFDGRFQPGPGPWRSPAAVHAIDAGRSVTGGTPARLASTMRACEHFRYRSGVPATRPRAPDRPSRRFGEG